MTVIQSYVAPATLDAIERVLPPAPPGIPPREVHARIGCFSRVTIRHGLRGLVRDGRATFAGCDCARLYWRSARP